MIRFGIDLGTNYIRLCTEDEGLIYNEPCMVALDSKYRVIGIGEDAKDLLNSTDPDVHVISPLSQDPIDFDALDLLLEQLFYEFKVFRMFKKTVLLVSYPTSFSSEDCETLKNHLVEFGADKVYFEQEIWIAAIGAKLDLFLPVASCVMNIGSSNCDIAVFSDGKIQKKSRFSLAGNSVNEVLERWLAKNYNISVSRRSVEKLKRHVGQVRLQSVPKSMEITGVDLQSRVLKKVVIDENQLVPVLLQFAQHWSNWISGFLLSLPARMQEDVKLRGIVCCGGTVLLGGLREYLQTSLGCPIYTTDDPINTVSMGLRVLLSRMEE